MKHVVVTTLEHLAWWLYGAAHRLEEWAYKVEFGKSEWHRLELSEFKLDPHE